MKTDNELIAEFMGCVFMKEIAKVKYYNVPAWHIESHNASCGFFKYHTRWDWLMPVVEKIESIRHIGIDAIYFKIEGKTCQIWTYFDVKEFLRLTGDDKNEGNKFRVGHTAKTKIEATYHACVDFIKWHNSQK